MFRVREKRIVLTENNLQKPQNFTLKSGQNVEISYTNHILPRRFQGTC